VAVGGETAEAGDGRIFPVAQIRPLRPVSVGAYFVQTETQSILELVKGSRHLLRARMTISPGGLAAAERDFASRQSPQILIIEDLGSTEALLRGLDALAQVCDTETRLVVIGRKNDVGLYRELTRRGVSEYLPLPIDAADVIRALSDLASGPDVLRSGRISACVGASGGVGSSSVAQNLSWLLAEERNVDILLGDLDLEYGSAGLRLNCSSARGLADVIGRNGDIDAEAIAGLLIQAAPNLKVLATPANGATPSFDFPAVATDNLMYALRQSADHVLLDLPRPRSSLTRRALAEADVVILVATPDLTSLRNARRILDLIRGLRPDEPDPLLVLNRVSTARNAQISARDFADVLGLKVFASLPDSPVVFHEADNAGKLVAALRRGKPLVQALRPVADRLTGRGPKSWLGRFRLGRFKMARR
jgi:pilus assembly protein CpaE